MINEELIKRLTAMKICTECQIKGKPCDDNCKWQYEAGNMGEIVQTLEQTIEVLEQMDVLDKIKAEIEENINYNKKMNYQGIVAGLLLTLNIINKYRKAN